MIDNNERDYDLLFEDSNTNIVESNSNNINNSTINKQPDDQRVVNEHNNDTAQKDRELLLAFIGKNYHKFINKDFNFACFFFSFFYMYYRKMYLYGLFFALINILIANLIDSFLVGLVLDILLAVFVNKMYLNHATKKVFKIKAKNKEKSFEEIKTICARKGGKSIISVFLGIAAQLSIVIIILFPLSFLGLHNIDNDISFFKEIINNINSDSSSSIKYDKIKNATIDGYSCIGESCTFSIKDSNNSINDYYVKGGDKELFIVLSNYKDYVKLNIEFSKSSYSNLIVDYKLFLASNGKNITNIKTEEDLRKEIGLFSLGIHKEKLLLKSINNNAIYKEYTFKDNNNNNEYLMKFNNLDNNMELFKDNYYIVTFEVKKESINYSYIISNIE